MLQLLCLVTLVIGCSALGFVTASFVFQPRNGFGGTDAWRFIDVQSWQLLGAIAGAYIGIAIELSWRVIIQRRRQFSLLGLLIFTTLLATLLVIIHAVYSALHGR